MDVAPITIQGVIAAGRVVIQVLHLRRPPGDTILQRAVEFAQLFLGPLAFGDLLEIEGKGVNARLLQQVADRALHPDVRAVLVLHAILPQAYLARVLHQVGQQLDQGRQIVGVRLLCRIGADKFLRRIADHAQARGAGKGHLTVAAQQDDRTRRVFDQQA